MSKKNEEEEYKKQAKAAGADFEDDEDEGDDKDEEEEESEDEEDEDDSEEDSDEEDEDDEDDSEDEDEDEDDEDEEDDSEDDEDEDEDDDDEDPKPPKGKKKVSIYQAYKQKKKETRELKTKVGTLESDMQTLKTKLDAFESADDGDDKENKLDDLETFAKEINASPEVLKKMRKLFNQGQEIDPSLKKDLLEFKSFKETHAKDMARVQFNEEFETQSSFLKELFPKMSKNERTAIKASLDKLVHSKGEFNDKPLDYVIFRNKDKLSKLLSPKKKGLESRERKDSEEFENDFDPNADLSEMSPKARAIWEKQYNKIMKRSEGLSRDSKGKRILI